MQGPRPRLSTLQLAWALLGVAFLAAGLSRGSRVASLLWSGALVASAVGSFVVLRSIHWA